MPNYQGTTARLRRTFHYPEEDSTDSQPEALDEQEQEDYIAQLAIENAARDVQFRRFLLAIPLLATIPYLPALINPPTSLLALLSLTSLFSTAYLLHHQPPTSSGIPFLDDWARPKTPRPTRPPSLSTRESSGRVKSEAVWPGMGYLPLVVYGIILVSKMVMGSVDPEKELSSLKYDYKGA
ncbi:hypothetical protein HG530_011251 [Fusarium avenaceum]|nr:hypothetical protein HG530_011251 [Fusarium avenaceum]